MADLISGKMSNKDNTQSQIYFILLLRSFHNCILVFLVVVMVVVAAAAIGCGGGCRNRTEKFSFP
jgi:hypothetical protein